MLPSLDASRNLIDLISRSNGNGHRGNGGISDNESDDDAEEGDYTVYE